MYEMQGPHVDSVMPLTCRFLGRLAGTSKPAS